MKLLDYKKPETIEEAFSLYELPDSEIIGGGAWLKLGKQEKALGIDLEKLGLSYIKDEEDGIHIGTLTSLYDLEFDPLIQGFGGGIVSKSASSIMGVQVRSIATIGGTVVGKFGFSDLIPSLLALDAKVRLYKAGIMTLEDFLDRKSREKDILIEVVLPKAGFTGHFETFKKTSIDFAVLNTAVASNGEILRVVVGSRPGGAEVVKESVETVQKEIKVGASLHEVAERLADQFRYGSNNRGSKEYRRQLAIALIADGMKEVLA